MEHRRQFGAKRVVSGIIAIAIAIGCVWGFIHFRRPGSNSGELSIPIAKRPPQEPRQELEFVDLPAETVKVMRLKTAAAEVPRFSKVLHLRGSLAIDSNRLSHVHARFPGQIVELATVSGLKSQKAKPASYFDRPLQNFDTVEEGMPLAVIWSKDLGEKKSALVEALVKLRVEKKTLEKYTTMTKDGTISDRQFREQQVKVEQGVLAAFSAEAILRAYQVSDADIKQVKDAAELIHQSQVADKSYAADWPRVIVSAPIGGVIVDKLVTVGEIVDDNAEMFKIADLSVLAVWLHPYEEDLPALKDLPKPLQVTINIPAHPEIGDLEGTVDRFSPMIDPNEHMALLIGTVPNRNGTLLANQFITADVGIPVEKGVVEIPSNAVIDIGGESIVYVQPDRSKPRFNRRPAKVVQRYFDVVYVRSELSDEQKHQNLHEIHVGDLVVSGGLLELEDYLQQQQQ